MRGPAESSMQKAALSTPEAWKPKLANMTASCRKGTRENNFHNPPNVPIEAMYVA